MQFVQIIEFRPGESLEKMMRISDEWAERTEGKRTARRSIVARDRNDPGRCFNIVFFDSYESAMENSNLPETQELSAQMMELAEGPAVFYDLDVIEDRT